MDKENTNIRVKFNEDYREVFKKDQVIEIPVPYLSITYLVGTNGCGKSTLLRAIRSQNATLEEKRLSTFDGCRNNKIEYVIKDIKAGKLEIKGTKRFSHIFAFDAEADDNTHVLNAASAYGFVAGGGQAAMKQSRGQAVMYSLYNFMEDFKKVSDKECSNENWRPLIIIDEVDEGLDIRMQINWNRILNNRFTFKGATILIVSHNPICMLSEGLFVNTFDVKSGRVSDPHEYIKNLTGYDITIKSSDEKLDEKDSDEGKS